ncbi:hypothetical protein KIMH_07720 [Bombiscardovia apis]|uniref:HTH tetR-type domain-containing protein n=1 Tax=Bombiscardovia apis TaxID=2932182 RepID=A0ABN6SHB8_9BIFI|nr:TetR/AcrR family transcriptional regulator [Bombiscardovia apis]BDR54661.1 hypothetical protein KIMH_07720 [Bombiscardovia apis]
MTARKKDNLQKRQEFIDTATELFRRKGVEDTSLRDVIKASNGGKGVSPSVFYYYFDSKNDLINACMDSYMGSYASSLVQALEDESQDMNGKIDAVLACVGQAWESITRIFPSTEERKDWEGRFDRYFIDSLFAKIVPAMSSAIASGLNRGQLPSTVLSRQLGPESIAELLCTGTSTICRRLRDPKSESIDHVKTLVKAYAGQLLGLPA